MGDHLAELHALDEQPWERVDDSLRKKVVDGERMTVTIYRFDPEGRFPLHRHPQEQITYVVAGLLTFGVEDEAFDVHPGQLIVLPSNLPHDAVAGPDGAEVVSVVSPARDPGTITLLERPR